MRASSSFASAAVEPLALAARVARSRGARVSISARSRSFSLARGLLGESHRHDPVELAAAAREHRDDPADQRGGFAGAGGGLDDQRGVEVVADTIAHALIGDLAQRSVGFAGAFIAAVIASLIAACAIARGVG